MDDLLVWIGFYFVYIISDHAPAFFERSRFKQFLDALKLSCDPFAEVTDRRQVCVGRNRFKLMLDLSPFCDEVIRLLVETE